MSVMKQREIITDSILYSTQDVLTFYEQLIKFSFILGAFNKCKSKLVNLQLCLLTVNFRQIDGEEIFN